MDKVRNVAHQIGNYPLFIYIPIPASSKYTTLAKTIQSKLSSSTLQLSPLTGYHLSLSLTSYLKQIEIDRFVASLKQSLASFYKFTLAVTNRIRYLCNEYDTRHFISIEINKTKQLNKVSEAIDGVLAEFGLDDHLIPLQDKVYHLSLLWDSIGEYDIDEMGLNEAIAKETQVIKLVKVESIKAKIGGKVYSIDLHDTTSIEKK